MTSPKGYVTLDDYSDCREQPALRRAPVHLASIDAMETSRHHETDAAPTPPNNATSTVPKNIKAALASTDADQGIEGITKEDSTEAGPSMTASSATQRTRDTKPDRLAQ